MIRGEYEGGGAILLGKKSESLQNDSLKDVAFLLKIENRYAQIISFVQKIVWDALRKIAQKGISVQFLGFSAGFFPRGSHESVVWRAPLLGPLNICFPRMQIYATADANVCVRHCKRLHPHFPPF